MVLTDLRMLVLDGVGTIEEIRRVAPGTPVLVLTTYDTDADILRAVEADAAGYLLKNAPRRVLVEAVRSAARGDRSSAPRWRPAWCATCATTGRRSPAGRSTC